MKPTKAETLREEIIHLRACQNAEGYNYDTDIECRIRAVLRELAALARRRNYNRVHRDMLFDINGHHGPA